MIFDRWRGAIGTRNTVGLVDVYPVRRSALVGQARAIKCSVWTPERVSLPVESYDFRKEGILSLAELLS